MSPSAISNSPMSAIGMLVDIGPEMRVLAVHQHAAGLADSAGAGARAGAVGDADVERNAGDGEARPDLGDAASKETRTGRESRNTCHCLCPEIDTPLHGDRCLHSPMWLWWRPDRR